ncbi:hypothetical protein B0T16DRAFT_154085 [Cercophora newfieldiana]|uniref:Calponin-homology (CH) domain-containing protein n=1 Tax=Cercophora newfieldiana TaxID=92897 RepID=A0AA39Y6Y0_9PEZI|nr:hypothetical protein B0T16DRAFT_154085 [Cercophora newfieldiana]
MASVSSLDKDLRKMRLDKYTPSAANEARSWIEGILGERLPSNDLLEGLRDGVALCRLVNLAVGPPGVKFKQSAMPFVQMENISHFLRACQAPPLNLQQHDMFLTVDLYEQKDPAQVLQCLGAFSRAANNANPSAFPTAIGPRANRGAMSPQPTGPTTPTGLRGRGISNASNASSSIYGRAPTLAPSKTGDSASGRWSPTKSPPPQNGSTSPVNVSSWSRKEHEGATSPAWNIAQYGYMGGASQGNLGIAFGGRRQITSAGPYVPNMADKEKRRREQEAEAERQRLEMEEEERLRKAELEAEEERARKEEERRWEEETRRLRDEERRKLEEEKRRWEEEERQWKLTEEKRRKEEEEAEARLQEERLKSRPKSNPKLRGQYLSQYQAEEESKATRGYSSRIKELEKELELARQREAEYERERQQRGSSRASGREGGREPVSKPKREEENKARSRSRSRPPRPLSRQDSWAERDDRDYLRTQWNAQQRENEAAQAAPAPPPRSPRPLPDPAVVASPPQKLKAQRTGGDGPPIIPVRKHNTGSRPLPDPAAYASTPPQQQPQPPQYQPQPQPKAPSPLPLRSQPPQQQQASPKMTRTDRYLASNPAPQAAAPPPTYSRELSSVDERDAEDRRRDAAQKQTKAGGWASKSLLEREMEMERQRQREWEDAQKETAKAVRSGEGVDGIGGGVGGKWDVSQWSGYASGDSQNRGAQGIGAGRRQIVGPRPLPGQPR